MFDYLAEYKACIFQKLFYKTITSSDIYELIEKNWSGWIEKMKTWKKIQLAWETPPVA